MHRLIAGMLGGIKVELLGGYNATSLPHFIDLAKYHGCMMIDLEARFDHVRMFGPAIAGKVIVSTLVTKGNLDISWMTPASFSARLCDEDIARLIAIADNAIAEIKQAIPSSQFDFRTVFTPRKAIDLTDNARSHYHSLLQ